MSSHPLIHNDNNARVASRGYGAAMIRVDGRAILTRELNRLRLDIGWIHRSLLS